MKLLHVDNEENGVLSMKIITNLHRAFKDQLEDQVKPFIEFVTELYKNIPQVVKETFSLNAVPSAGNTPIAAFNSPHPSSPSIGPDFNNETSNKPLQRCLYSFKVLTECPIIVVLLYSTHPALADDSIEQFLTHIIEILKLQAPPQANAHAAAANRKEIYTSISPQIKNRAVYGDFITAQVKTMSFVAYTPRHFPKILTPYRKLIPEFIVRLLQDCPCELSPARKELLVATRHILSIDIRQEFIPKIDILLDENVLIGKGLTVYETLRPLAYTTMADLIHHVRAELTPEQIWKTVSVYCKNIQDNTLPTNFQIMSAKLLFNLAERIMNLQTDDRAEGRQIMFFIVDAFVQRFTTLNRSYSHIMKSHQKFVEKETKTRNELNQKYTIDIEVTLDKALVTKLGEESETTKIKSEDVEMPDVSEESKENLVDPSELDFLDLFNDKPIRIHNAPNVDELKDARTLFKNLMSFLKSFIYGLKFCNPPPPSTTKMTPEQWNESARVFNFEQVTVLRNLFRQGILGNLFFASEASRQYSKNATMDFSGNLITGSITKDEKDLMEIFATIFIHIDSDTFNEILEAELPFLYDSLFSNPALLHIPQVFLSNESSCSNFASVLFKFLKKKLPDLGNGDPATASILIRLFKLSFMTVTLYPQKNESILLPHLSNLIISCLELATTAKDPLVYFHVLRSLFRSISGGKFEKLYQEILPLLQLLLGSLNNLLTTARRPQERDIYVELCLTVPVRLSVLVPHLSYLMRPLVIALNGSPELVSQGLRTFELCVDNLTSEYFDPILEPVIDEIMRALFKHLKPLPHNHQHSHICLRILGKLGGRNRKYLQVPSDLENLSVMEQEVSVMLDINGLTEKKPLKLTPAIQYALITLEDTKMDLHYRTQAFKYLSTALKLMIDTTMPCEDYVAKIHACIEVFRDSSFPETHDKLGCNPRADTKARRLQNELFERLLESIFYATSIPELKDEAYLLIKNICEHCVLLDLGELLILKRQHAILLDVDDHEGPQRLDPKSLLSATIYALCHYLPEISDAGKQAVHYVFDSGLALFRSPDFVHKFPMFKSLFGKLTHTCFEEQYYRKAGACLGLSTLIKDLNLSIDWIKDSQLELVRKFIRTMLFVLKDIPSDVPSHVRKEAKDLLLYVLEQCNKEITEEQQKENGYLQLTGLLTYELANSNEFVRETSQAALGVLSRVTNKTISQIIKPVQGVLLPPVFSKPLRALPFPMQIGNIDAIRFCLGLPDTFLEFNDELDRLMLEALALVEADDNSLATSYKAKEHRTSELIVQLRVGCIKLLSLALTLPQYEAIQQSTRRSKILTVFFKTLYVRSKKVVDAAHTGLRAVTNNNRLPKDILSLGLRPMLVNFSDWSKLTVDGLEGLARLLEALTSYFKVEIGNKLLEHLNAWVDPDTVANHPNKESFGDTTDIIVAILNVFHLLPTGAFIFMSGLVNAVFKLENNMRRQHSSPYREPVAKFLNRYSPESFQFFLNQINSHNFGRLFYCILQMENTDNLREYCKSHFDEVIKALKEQTQPEAKIHPTSNVIYVFKVLAQSDPEWAATQAKNISELLQLSDIVQTAKGYPHLSPIHLQVDQMIEDLQIGIAVFLKNVLDFDVLTQTIASIHAAGYKIHPMIEDIIYDNIIAGKDMETRRKGLMKSLEVGTNKQTNIDARTFFFRNIINPTLIFEGKVKGELAQLIEKPVSTPSQTNWIDQVHERIWKGNGLDANDENPGSLDYYRFELLNTSALLIKLSPTLISDAKKDIIKFGWSFIKIEDIVSKQAAYVLIAYFIAAYETLPKIVLQIYIHLLKCNQNDAKVLVRQALDLLAPVLKDRVTKPLWAKWPRRVITEDGHNASHASSIYYFIVRHPKLFFDYRDHFVQTIISAMPKLSMVPGAAAENVVLAVDLADLILTWESMANEQQEQQNSRKRRYSNIEKNENESSNNDKSSTNGSNELPEASTSSYSIPLQQREACITYLIRFICANNQKITDISIGRKVVGILSRLLSNDYWPEVAMKLAFFDKPLIAGEFTNARIPLALNALYVIGITAYRKDVSWVIENLPHLQQLLQRPLKSDIVGLLEAAINVVVVVLDALKKKSNTGNNINNANGIETENSAITEFVNFLFNTIQENFSSNGALASGIMISWALARFRPSKIESLLPSLMKLFSRLVRDHIPGTQDQAQPGQDSTAAAATASEKYDTKVTTKLLLMILDIGSVCISDLNDQRRIFLTHFGLLLERSVDKEIGLRLIEITRHWVFSKASHFPTMKEKATILTKMIIFEVRGDQELSKKLFEILIDIYTDPLTSRTELSSRMESLFMLGTRTSQVDIRRRLMDILNSTIDENALKRLNYIISGQNWEYLGDTQWTNQALQILYKGFGSSPLRLRTNDFTTAKLDLVLEALPTTYTRKDSTIYESTEKFVKDRIAFVKSISYITADEYFSPIVELQYKCPELVHKTWANLFPLIQAEIPKKDRLDFLRAFIVLISKDFHNAQSHITPNVIQTLIEGASKCEQLQIPPHLVKYLGKTFNTWYPAIQSLENIQFKPLVESFKISQANSDALLEIYSDLQENDMFYGLWRRKAKYTETNTALSYEQIGMWGRATQMYEAAQIKARSGALPYNESEYSLWEDHWVICTQKLQQWDILAELAKHENFTDLLLECGWRVADWSADKDALESSIKNVMDVPTPRRQVFETFLCLQSYATQTEKLQDVYRQCDAGFQLALRKWSQLPTRLTGAHIPLLHTFQQYVEFLEASSVYTSLHKTVAANLDTKSNDIKSVLKAWRERLPNLWDDIDIWSDLVTWRKHAFSVINKTYDPLIKELTANNNNSTSYAYRGYHEIAWIINKFAHACRKHGMLDVCISQLNIIYNLPNIEIQEAFLKLREQAKCYYQNSTEYHTGLEVISNTNLVYFNSTQKAEFFTLKGMFFAKLSQTNDAEKAFALAVQVDLYHPKAWAEWGYFNDRLYQRNPKVIKYASTALQCYLQAASLYKDRKTRKLLSRILWLISIEDDSDLISSSFKKSQGEIPVWYWITFIPQLLTALSHKESEFAHNILIHIAKAYPQALVFHLRTAKEDFQLLQRQQMLAQNQANGRNGAGTQNAGRTSGSSSSSGTQPWEYTDRIMNILKTAYPLLSFSLETLIDQIIQRFKCLPEEDAYRLVMALLNEGVQYMGRPQLQKDRPLPTEASIVKFAESVLPEYTKPAFAKDFLKEKPEFDVYIQRLRKWRDRFEEMLDRRPGTMNLEALGPHLSEFHYQRFEDVEVPGQYSELKDDNMHFIKVDRFMPTVDLVRGFGQSYKRIKILGHNGSIHMFAVQYPSGRQCRREERVVQLFKILNSVLARKKESRRRNITLTLPTAIPFTPHVRIIQDDPHYISMHAIYEDHCRRVGRSRDEALDYSTKKLRAAWDPKLPRADINSVKTEILTAIQATIVPSTILRDYFTRTYATFEDFWLFRKQFSYQFAGVTFMTFLMCINNRYPHKYFINTRSGAIWTTDMLPVIVSKSVPIIQNPELVPFRLTPNIQTLMGTTALEGIFSVSVMVIAKCLTETAHELDQYIAVFVREELVSWFTQQQRPPLPDDQLRETTVRNVGFIGKRATSLAQVGQGNIPANQTVIDLISQAVNPRYMAMTDSMWMPYL